MTRWDRHLEEAVSFVEEHRALVDCHLVDFITNDSWNECLPARLRLELESRKPPNPGTIDENGDTDASRSTGPELETLVRRARSLSLKNSVSVTKLAEFGVFGTELERLGESDGKVSGRLTSEKKRHEIEVLGRLVGRLIETNGIDLAIDAGSGKGYLSESISQHHGIPVLAIDSSDANVRGALRRRKKLHGRANEENISVRYTVERIEDGTDYRSILRSQFGTGNAANNCILSGLHACGQLTHSMMRHFLSADYLKCLCVVPCCYHLTGETLTVNYNFTKNARMIAQQSVERTESREPGHSPSPSLFYRALLQVILQSLGIGDARIGRGAPCRDFPSYAQWALTKIGVDRDKIPSIETLAQLHQRHRSSHWKLNVFQSIRIHVGAVVEAAIVLDRVVYMRNSENCSTVALVQLFDPLISPRCYAIVATKRTVNLVPKTVKPREEIPE